MHSAPTAREMSPSELAECRENLKRQWENRRVDKALLQRAWAAAHRVAILLYQDFGAARVAVFGSLAELERFTKVSDTDERAKIERVISSITELLQEIEVAIPRHRKFFEELTAKKLVEVYNGIDRIFERIAREVDMHTPKGNQWHNNLLKQMAERQPERPPVVSQETLPRLKELLDFRHKVNNIYGNELIYEKAEEHAKPIEELFATVSEELDTFIAFLTEPPSVR